MSSCRERPYTNGELDLFRRCRRAWWFKFHRGLQRVREEKEVGHRELGSLVHAACEALYSGGGPLAAMRVLHEAEEAAGENRDALKQVDLAARMIEGYIEWLEETGADEGLEVVSTEQILEAELYPGGPVVRSKCDRRVRDHSLPGAPIRILDEKTVQNLSDLPKLMRLETQFKHYMLVERLQPDAGSAELTTGAILSMLRKVKRTKSAKPPFYGREDVYHTDDELRAYWHEVLNEILDIEAMELRLEGVPEEDHHFVAYPTPTRDCTWRCDYFVPCTMMDQRRGDAEAVLQWSYELSNPLAHHGDQEEDA